MRDRLQIPLNYNKNANDSGFVIQFKNRKRIFLLTFIKILQC